MLPDNFISKKYIDTDNRLFFLFLNAIDLCATRNVTRLNYKGIIDIRIKKMEFEDKLVGYELNDVFIHAGSIENDIMHYCSSLKFTMYNNMSDNIDNGNVPSKYLNHNLDIVNFFGNNGVLEYTIIYNLFTGPSLSEAIFDNTVYTLMEAMDVRDYISSHSAPELLLLLLRYELLLDSSASLKTLSEKYNFKDYSSVIPMDKVYTEVDRTHYTELMDDEDIMYLKTKAVGFMHIYFNMQIHNELIK